MSLFGSTGTSVFGAAATTVATTNHNPMKDIEVVSAPDDSVSCMEFNPAAGGGTVQNNFLVAGSWANDVRCWEVQTNGATVPKAQQMHQGPVLDVAWHSDSSKVFTASCDKTAKVWDLQSNQSVQVAQHDAPVKTCHWIQSPTYSCLMTGSWDKTLKFWDMRQSGPILTLPLQERCYCADVVYPMAVVGTASRGIIIYQLDSNPREYRRIDSPLKFQHRSVSIFRDMKSTVAAAGPKPPTGFALGSVEGRVAIQYINPTNPKDNFTFKCHRSAETNNGMQDIFAVNSIAFHPTHGTLATVGSDGRFSYWDKDARTKLKTSDCMEQSITDCAFSGCGTIFAYAVSYDWSKGHQYYNAQKKNYIFLHSCYDELKPRTKK